MNCLQNFGFDKRLLYDANIVAYRIDDTVYGSQMGTFPRIVNVVVTVDGEIDAMDQFDIENYDVEGKKGQHYIVTVSEITTTTSTTLKTDVLTATCRPFRAM